MEVESEVGGAGVVFAACGGYSVEWEPEVLKYALAHFEAAEGFFARPVKDTVEVAALGQLEHDLGCVGGRARLAYFVAVEFRLLTGMDGLKQFFVNAALSGGAVAHEDGQAKDDGILGVVLEHFTLGHELGLAVERSGGRHIGGAVGRIRSAVEDHVARHMNKAGTEVGGELGKEARQGDVYFFGFFGLGIDVGGV